MISKKIFLFSTLLLYILISCNKSPKISERWEFFAGRDNGESFDRPLLYRAQVPLYWLRKNPLENESIADTTKAICEYQIKDNDQFIRITLHTFPILQDDKRIPPQAQIARWKSQFEEIDLVATQTSPDAHGGYSGLFFEGEGLLQGNLTKVMGWSMQLATIYERQLSQGKKKLDQNKRADYTIKAVGSPEMMNKHRLDIIAFANSFELIDELPEPR